MRRILLAAACALLAAGCAPNWTFVYKPGAPGAGVRKVAADVVVLPFEDATEGFKTRGSVLTTGYVNLAKTEYYGMVSPLTPPLLAKSFSEELQASGRFRSARFEYDVADAPADAVIVEGAVTKATVAMRGGDGSRFGFRLKARRGKDGATLWEREIGREASHGREYGDDCMPLRFQCPTDSALAFVNGMLREIFAEAGADLARTLAPPGKEPDAVNPAQSDSPPAESSAESVEETLEGILKAR
jgi:hypothetical protein